MLLFGWLLLGAVACRNCGARVSALSFIPDNVGLVFSTDRIGSRAGEIDAFFRRWGGIDGVSALLSSRPRAKLRDWLDVDVFDRRAMRGQGIAPQGGVAVGLSNDPPAMTLAVGAADRNALDRWLRRRLRRRFGEGLRFREFDLESGVAATGVELTALRPSALLWTFVRGHLVLHGAEQPSAAEKTLTRIIERGHAGLSQTTSLLRATRGSERGALRLYVDADYLRRELSPGASGATKATRTMQSQLLKLPIEGIAVAVRFSAEGGQLEASLLLDDRALAWCRQTLMVDQRETSDRLRPPDDTLFAARLSIDLERVGRALFALAAEHQRVQLRSQLRQIQRVTGVGLHQDLLASVASQYRIFAIHSRQRIGWAAAIALRDKSRWEELQRRLESALQQHGPPMSQSRLSGRSVSSVRLPAIGGIGWTTWRSAGAEWALLGGSDALGRLLATGSRSNGARQTGDSPLDAATRRTWRRSDGLFFWIRVAKIAKLLLGGQQDPNVKIVSAPLLAVLQRLQIFTAALNADQHALHLALRLRLAGR